MAFYALNVSFEQIWTYVSPTFLKTKQLLESNTISDNFGGNKIFLYQKAHAFPVVSGKISTYL